MSKFMKILNNISRSQAIYRHSRVSDGDIQGNHYSFLLAICREPGRSQEDLARELCVNKSTVARNVCYLEEKGYVERQPLENDKRQFSVFPTSKALEILPEIRSASEEWMSLLSQDIPKADLEVFDRVLKLMQEKARSIIDNQEVEK